MSSRRLHLFEPLTPIFFVIPTKPRTKKGGERSKWCNEICFFSAGAEQTYLRLEKISDFNFNFSVAIYRRLLDWRAENTSWRFDPHSFDFECRMARARETFSSFFISEFNCIQTGSTSSLASYIPRLLHYRLSLTWTRLIGSSNAPTHWLPFKIDA